MNPYRYRAALRATHPHADLAPLFDALQLRPTRLWTAGQPRPGAGGGEARYRDSYAAAALTGGEARAWSVEPLEDFLQRTLARLEPHRPAFERLAAGGGRGELALELSGGARFGFAVSAAVCEALTRLKLSFAIDVYPGPDD
ncbi:hypothetical protein [Vulcaniibacterium tengchongense]|uniref:DUF4279 domain-containing protein n=1 Tax=Vulcaniibacterium tengchongense TaxID=1273429 RepID=A0A3N4VJN4_9GAMM|nr:hypothetical protein [Vulcaniibacterium tengchongense]RPE79929.1 hypothetical protein EDC50_1758 [Vulcaniibacterium tengchongense]